MYNKATRTGAISHLQGASTQNRNVLPARESITAGSWEEGDHHQLVAPASLQQQHKAQQLLPAQASLNCCHFILEREMF